MSRTDTSYIENGDCERPTENKKLSLSLQTANKTTCETSMCFATFIMAMLIHELAVENASREYGIKLNILPYAVALFQHGGCVTMPLLVATCRRRGTKMVGRQENATSAPVLCNTFSISGINGGASAFFPLGFVLLSGTVLSSMSLRYVNYPTKIIFKSTSHLLANAMSTSFTLQAHVAYLSYTMILIGILGYAYDELSMGGSKSTAVFLHNNHLGLLLLTTSVVFDVWVSKLRQELNVTLFPLEGKAHESELSPTTSSWVTVMMYTHGIGFVLLALGLLVTGQAANLFSFCAMYPELTISLFVLGLSLACATMAMNHHIVDSHSPFHRDSSTTRDFVVATQKATSVILSFAIFPKVLLFIHLCSGLSVLAGALLLLTKRQQHPQQQQLPML